MGPPRGSLPPSHWVTHVSLHRIFITNSLVSSFINSLIHSFKDRMLTGWVLNTQHEAQGRKAQWRHVAASGSSEPGEPGRVLNGETLTHRRADPGPGRVKEPPRSPEEGDSREADARLSLWLAVPSPCSEPEWKSLSSWGRRAPQAGKGAGWNTGGLGALWHVAGQTAHYRTWGCPEQGQWAPHTGCEGRLQAHLAGPDHPAPP